jgi:hypothetical protein
MQDRYTGDIGDFSKLGLLRVLQADGFSIGLNWYLTPDETHNSDGRHVQYLHQEEYRTCDEGLWLELKAIVDAGKRAVRFMENDRVLKATFFSNCLDFRASGQHGTRKHKPKAERSRLRGEWFEESLAALAGKDIVCVDPDNGLVVPSAKGGPKENKYVLPEELARYYAQGSSIIYYQHKARHKDERYIQQHEALVQGEGFPGAKGLSLKFEKTSQRYYMFITQPEHSKAIEHAVGKMLLTNWGRHFRLLK